MLLKPIFGGGKVCILDLSKQQGMLSSQINMERIKLFDNTIMAVVTSGESSWLISQRFSDLFDLFYKWLFNARVFPMSFWRRRRYCTALHIHCVE